ncbi:MAG: phosphatidylethanolamine N-methyltransferase family protein [Anaerolineales bacterium]|nr:phosphatidylethanolamine N-methyltransferase family protein [Anaerolineales bacterium]
METLLVILFSLNLIALFALLAGIVWSVARPDKRIWPPPGKSSWQYKLAWILFYQVFGLNTVIILLDWNSWIFLSPLRFLIGLPIALVGVSLLIWGIQHLGTINTSGISDRFVKTGPYRFTRNPQYLGDMLLFLGLSILTNSLYLWITHILLILVFAITPLAEEDWLGEQYSESYQTYLDGTSRFL